MCKTALDSTHQGNCNLKGLLSKYKAKRIQREEEILVSHLLHTRTIHFYWGKYLLAKTYVRRISFKWAIYLNKIICFQTLLPQMLKLNKDTLLLEASLAAVFITETA